MNSNFGNSDFEEPEGHPVKHGSWAQKNLAQALTQSLAGEGCCPARGGWNHALSGSLIASWNCTPWVHLPITFLITVSGIKSMEEGIVLVHGFRTCGPWLLDSIHLGETMEEETRRRNLHFLMAKKQRGGPKGARHNTPSRACCQWPTSVSWSSSPRVPRASPNSIISYQSLIKKTWAYACCTKTMIVAKCLRHCV